MKKLLIILISLFAILPLSVAHAEKYGVYVKAVEKVEGSFEDTISSVEGALKKNGWEVLASNGNSVPEACDLRAHTIVIKSDEYTGAVMGHGPLSSFAVPLRVGIYENETGLNIAFTNPASLNRTILGDKAEAELSVNTMNSLSDILAGAVKGTAVKEQIGQLRKKGKVGGMGGGDFKNMMVEFFSGEGKTVAGITEKVKEGIEANEKGWKLVYEMALDGGNIMVLGVNEAEMEARAYRIAGEKRESKDNSCPGIDHSPAFPIEVMVYETDEAVKIITLDGMYRMKVYFEDAGMWAFMKNMAMPAGIISEIEEMSISKLK